MTTKKEFIAELVKDRATWERVLRRVTKVVSDSFEYDRRASGIVLISAVPTQSEIKHRTNICYDWFATMRTDFHYSTARALDMLPKALRASLDGTDWAPQITERGWAPPKEPV